jgi:hypothetical protein
MIVRSENRVDPLRRVNRALRRQRAGGERDHCWEVYPTTHWHTGPSPLSYGPAGGYVPSIVKKPSSVQLAEPWRPVCIVLFQAVDSETKVAVAPGEYLCSLTSRTSPRNSSREPTRAADAERTMKSSSSGTRSSPTRPHRIPSRGHYRHSIAGDGSGVE